MFLQSFFYCPTGEAAFFQVDEEVCPAFFVFLHAFSRADDLAIAIIINTDGNKDGNVLKLTSPAAFKECVIHVNIWIIPAKRTGSPFLDVRVSFLIEVADRSRRDLGSPQNYFISSSCFRIS